MPEINLPGIVRNFLEANKDVITHSVNKYHHCQETVQTILTDLISYHLPEYPCDTAQRQILDNNLDYESVDYFIAKCIVPSKMRYDWKSKEASIFKQIKRGDNTLTIARSFGFPEKSGAALTSYLGKFGGRNGFVEYYAEKVIEENVAPIATPEFESKERKAEKFYGVLMEHHINDEAKLAELRVLSMKLAQV